MVTVLSQREPAEANSSRPIRRQFLADEFVISAGCIPLKRVDESKQWMTPDSDDPVSKYDVVLIMKTSSGELEFPRGRRTMGERLEDTARRATFKQTAFESRLVARPVATNVTAVSITVPSSPPTAASTIANGSGGTRATGTGAAIVNGSSMTTATMLKVEPIACSLRPEPGSDGVQEIIYWFLGFVDGAEVQPHERQTPDGKYERWPVPLETAVGFLELDEDKKIVEKVIEIVRQL